MRIALFSLGCLLGLSVSARAEDFTGVYAGVNAGYAFQSGDGRTHGLGSDAPRRADRPIAESSTLPPSAEVASRALHRDRSSPSSAKR